MCMGRPVIATRSQGIVGFVIDGETGILVEPGDVVAMREAIQDLLTHPQEAHRLGSNARQRIEDELNLDVYVKHIAQLLRSYL
jgi:glycosyltransferase involved in cell wall biosynthesis